MRLSEIHLGQITPRSAVLREAEVKIQKEGRRAFGGNKRVRESEFTIHPTLRSAFVQYIPRQHDMWVHSTIPWKK